MIDHATENKLTIVSAPAGYGKTSLLIDFANKTNYPICWYSLESTDNKLIKFVEGLIQSIQVRYSKFGLTVQSAIRTGSTQKMDGRTLAALFLNDLNLHIDDHFIVILDDFQLIDTNNEIDNFLNDILIESDENFHLVISSRALLGFHDLPLLVARSQVGGLSYEELSFTKQEIKDLVLLIQKRTISDHDAESILKNCEGWVMGLLFSTQLANGALDKVFPKAASREIGINNFLALQVLHDLPNHVQHFLLMSSLFDKFDLQSFSKVIKEAGVEYKNWQDSFNFVIEHNLFVIPVGEKHTYYRYHNLFLDFLRANMLKQYPEETRKIQLALAEYYEKSKEWGKAFNLYNAIGELGRNISLISEASPEMIAKGRITEVEEWLLSIPKSETERSAAILSTWGAIASIRGNYEEGIHFFGKALSKTNIDTDKNLILLTLSRRAGTFRFTGEYEKSIEDSAKILELCGFENKYLSYAADASFFRGTCYSFLGNWESAQEEIQISKQKYTAAGEMDGVAKCWLQMGFILKSIGQYQNAQGYYKKALTHYRDTKNIVWEASVLNNMGVLAQIQCDFKQAFEYFEKAFEYAGVTKNRRMETYLLASIGDLYTDLGSNFEALVAYDQALTKLHKETDRYLNPYLYISKSKAEQKDDEALRLLAKAREQLLLSPNQNLIHNLELQEADISIRVSKGKTGIKSITEVYEYFVEHNQLIDSISTLAKICWCVIKYPGSINLDVYRQKIHHFLTSPEFSKYLLLLLQKHGLTLTDILDLPKDILEQQKIRVEWEKVIENKAKARQYIRRSGSIVPLRPAKVSIRSFGKTQVARSEKLISLSDWKSQNARDLFIYLAVNHMSFTKEEIGEVFWPESTTDDLKLRFKNTIYRLRKAIGRDVILFEGDHYELNRNIDFEFDYESFLEEVNSVDYAVDGKDSLKNYLQAIRLYRGPFLGDVDMAWANQIREETGQKYFGCLINIASRYVEMEDYENGLKYATKASEFDPYSEISFQLVMRSLGGMGDRAGVIRQYQKLVKNLKDELEIEPSIATMNLYNLLIR